MQIGSGWRDVLAEHLVPNLVIGMHGPFGGVALIDADDVRKIWADLGQYLLDIAVEPTRFAEISDPDTSLLDSFERVQEMLSAVGDQM